MSSLRIWLDASRPKTLTAAIVPVMTGIALAVRNNLFRADTAVAALLCALLIQIGTNFANDYFDAQKGADTDKRVGFQRATASGLVSPNAMKRAMILTMLAAFIGGLYLVWTGGLIVLWIGLLSILFGILYTGGPYPLGYNGLGDLFVFLFFGIVAVSATYYVQALEWSTDSFLLAVPVGALAVNILVINNLRDVEEDRVTGKRTLGVMFGERALKAEYILMNLLTIPPLFILHQWHGYNAWIFLPLLSFLPFGLLWRQVLFHKEKSSLNQTLERTAQVMVLFGILLCTGLILSV